MPIAKTAQQQAPQAPTPAITPQSGMFNQHEVNSVPIDIIHFFNVEYNENDKVFEKLRVIYDWGCDGAETLGDVMQKIRRIEDQLGQTGFEKRYDRIYNWVRLTKRIEDLDKRRDALRKRW